MKIKAEVIGHARFADLGWMDRLRKLHVVAPFVVFLYCLLVKRGILDGRAGLYYGFQRMLAEAILSLHLTRQELVDPEG